MKIKTRGRRAAKLLAVAAISLIALAGLTKSSHDSMKVSASVAGLSLSHTGAGEANCTACHGDFPVNSGTGNVAIAGVPANYLPNQNHSITVTTTQSDAVIFGFQLTAIDSTARATVGTFTLPLQDRRRCRYCTGWSTGSSELRGTYY